MSAEHCDALLSVLPASNLPRELVAWLVRGLEVHQAGGDLLSALDLPGADMDRRDSLVRVVLKLTPGESFSARAAFFLDALAGNEEHPRQDMQQIIRKLRLLPWPGSVRQLRRIVAGHRQDGWRENGT
jgi:hypothetical protein